MFIRLLCIAVSILCAVAKLTATARASYEG